MRKIFTTLSLTLAAFYGFAQQDPQVTHNMYNRLATNAGYAGTSGGICGNLIGRQQWTNFPGAPKSGILSIDAPILQGTPAHGGVGLTVYSDQLGNEKTFTGKLAYSYHLNLGTGKLGIGLELGMLNKSISGAWIAPDGTDGGSDGSIPNQKVSDMAFDCGLGVYYTNDKLYAGISTTHLNAGTLKKAAGSATSGGVTTTKELNYSLARHYYITAGYNQPIGSSIILRPSIFVKTDASSTQLDVNVNALFNNMFYVGASYRLTDAIAAMAGLQWKEIRFGYAYDVTTSNLKVASKGSHELTLGYCYKIVDKPVVSKSKNVRFL